MFNVLGETAYRDALDLAGRWDALPRPCAQSDAEDWVRAYFAYLDEHGAFIFSAAQSSPDDEEFRTSSKQTQTRMGWLLGVNLRNRQRDPVDAPEALGLTIVAMLERSWFHCRVQQLPVSDDEMVRTIATIIMATFDA